MNLHEYQAKALLAQYGLPAQIGLLASSAEEAALAFDQIKGSSAVIKVQVHAGGRGKAGGIKRVNSREEASKVASGFIGGRMVNNQTGADGLPINKVMLCENIYPVKRELYLGAVIDRSTRRVTFMASTEGGVDIESVALASPEKIIKVAIDPLVGAQPNQAREFAFALGLQGEQINQFTKLMLNSYRAFIENDFALFEINPLSILQDDSLSCVDVKINLDSNAMYRHPELLALRDKTQENERELEASEFGLNYVALSGNIGCMVNGAGLAMATMDIIKLYGGRPANFLDVGGAANKECVIEAFKLILADVSVKGVFINIFGGIVRCDMIAEAIIAAVKEVKVSVPVVVRLEGNHAEQGVKLLEESGLKLIAAEGLADGAQKIVAEVVELAKENQS